MSLHRHAKSICICPGALDHLGHIGIAIGSQTPSWTHGTNANTSCEKATACEPARTVVLLAGSKHEWDGWRSDGSSEATRESSGNEVCTLVAFNYFLWNNDVS